jgi:hypothetical protein
MYNHLLICTCGKRQYEAICESAPTKEETILFWPDDLGLPFDEKEAMLHDLIEWADSQDFKYIVYKGKGR